MKRSAPANSTSAKRKRLTIEEKRQVIYQIKAGKSVSCVAALFEIGKQTVRDITKRESSLDHYQMNFDGDSRKNMRRPADENVDLALYQWFRGQRAAGAEISGLMVQTKALEFNRLLDGPDSFTASSGWLWRFQKRHGIHDVPIEGERQLADYPAAETFSATLQSIIANENLSPHQLYNIDETGLVYRQTPKSTLGLRTETSAPGRKIAKDRVTLLVGANASGSDRLPLLMIGKSKTPRCFNKANPDSIPVKYTHQRSSWMDANIFEDYMKNTLFPHVKKTLKKHNLPQRAIITIDNATVHRSFEKDGISTLFLPANTTSVIQPMDQGVIAALKKRYRTQFMKKIADREDGVSVIDEIKKWNLMDTAVNISECWAAMKESTLKNAWNNILPDAPAAIAEEPELDEPVNTVGISLDDWEKEDDALITCEELTDQQIVDIVLNKTPQPEEEEVDEEPPQPVTEPDDADLTPAEARAEFERIFRITVRQPWATPQHTLHAADCVQNAKRLEADAANKKKQTSLDLFFKKV